MTLYPGGPSLPGRLQLLSCFSAPPWGWWVIAPKASCAQPGGLLLYRTRFLNMPQLPEKQEKRKDKRLAMGLEKTLVYKSMQQQILVYFSFKLH